MIVTAAVLRHPPNQLTWDRHDNVQEFFMVLPVQSLSKTFAIEQFHSNAPAIPMTPYPEAIAYVAVNPGDLRTKVSDISRWADWTAAVADAKLKDVRQGIRELPRFLAQMLTYDHVIASCGGPISMEARVFAASWTGLAETTFHLSESYRWVLPYAIERFITEISAVQKDEELANDYVNRGDFDAHLMKNMRVVSRSDESRMRSACVLVNSAKDRLPILRTSTTLRALGASLHKLYVNRASDCVGADLRQMTEGLYAEKYDLGLFVDGDPAELSVKVTVSRGNHFHRFELVSSFKGAQLLLDVLASLIGDAHCRFRSTLAATEAA
jgi:hypothetical protein